MKQNKELDKKIYSFKAKNTKIDKKKPAEKEKNFRAISIGLKISLDLVASVIAGVLVGLGVDKLFDTKPFFFLIFLILGIAAGLMNMYRAVMKLENK